MQHLGYIQYVALILFLTHAFYNIAINIIYTAMFLKKNISEVKTEIIQVHVSKEPLCVLCENNFTKHFTGWE